MTDRERIAAEAQRLRAAGLKWREIADRLGMHLKTVYDYATDPTGETAHARRHKKDGSCVGCGATTHSGGAVPPERCRRCAGARQREMSRRWIIQSINEWIDMFGVPPTAVDWNQARARARGRWDVVRRYESTGRVWPSVTVTQANFGSWNAAIAAAGWDPRPQGTYGRDGEIVDASEIAALYEAGKSTREIAADLGICAKTVTARLHKAGVPVRSRADAQRLRWEKRRAA